MKKEITEEQIKAVLQTIYQTNISAQNFDALQKFFAEFPLVKTSEEETPLPKK